VKSGAWAGVGDTLRSGAAHLGPKALSSSDRFIAIGVLMRIVVDLNRCLGYAQCVPLAPEVLKLSGEEALTYDPNPDDAQRLRVLRAAASCPVQAIIVDQLASE